MKPYIIHIDRLCLHAFHGVMEQERRVGADFFVSLVANIEVGEEAYKQDKLKGTVSYADIIQVIKREMDTPSNLLEHVAYRTAEALLSRFSSMQSVTLRIDKDNPPCGESADAIGVSIELNRK